MKILAFDTATAQGSVAVLSGNQLLSEKIWRRAQSHSECLTAEIEAALQDSKLNITDIDAFAVGQGPGSFTGIRVAINAARALAYALKKPAYVFETSETLVFPVNRTELPVLTLINAQKNSFFVSRFESTTKGGSSYWRRTRDLSFMSLNEVQNLLTEPHLCLGDGCLDLELALRPEAKLNFMRDSNISDFPLASSLAQQAISPAKGAQPSGWNAVQPLYIRASGAEEMLREGSKS
jgi:tRNA threonylcarbamoyladenosine biosynthesis protein TsaB